MQVTSVVQVFTLKVCMHVAAAWHDRDLAQDILILDIALPIIDSELNVICPDRIRTEGQGWRHDRCETCPKEFAFSQVKGHSIR